MDFYKSDKFWNEFFYKRLVKKRTRMWKKIDRCEAELNKAKDAWGRWINIQMDLEWREFYRKRTGRKYAGD